MNTYQPVLTDQNPDRLHAYEPDGRGGCRWCYTPQDKHLSPWVHLVPRELQANLARREQVLDLAVDDPTVRGTLTEMCRQDILFYVNLFGWVFEPRGAKQLPFITWPYQDEALHIIADCIGKCDLVVEKSRDMGASWCCVTTFNWYWRFQPFNMFLMLSRKEELVEKKGDPKTLFWKLDYLNDHLPYWLRPPVDQLKMHRENLGNGSSIDGESTNLFAGVADRRLALLLDEYSKMENQDLIAKGTRDTTDSRIFNFTPQGSSNEAFRVATNPNFRKLSLHWHLHPHKSRGLYSVGAGGKPELLDKEYWTPERVAAYRFSDVQPDNPRYHYRSPWYDEQCKRALHPKEIAEELDIDYQASNFGFYDSNTIKALIAETAREPFLIGELQLNRDHCSPDTFLPTPGGRLKLWIRPDAHGRIPDGRRFVIAADVSMGTGGEYSSESTLTIADQSTGEKVGEFADSAIAPHDHARLAVSLCRWFSGSGTDEVKLIWESNGPGQMFGREIVKVGYTNVYYREKLDRTRTPKRGDIAGFHASDGPDGTKIILHGGYRRALAERRFINRSDKALRQTIAYVWTTDRKIEHSAALASTDPVTAGSNHGDLVVSDALACLLLDEKTVADEPQKRYPPSCIYTRIEKMRRERAQRQVMRY